MSAETRAALEAAIADHFSDEIPEQVIVTDWTLTIAGVPLEHGYVRYLFCSTDSGPHVREGLLRRHLRMVTREPLNLDD